MNLYTAVLFVHAIAVLVLTAALTMEAWVLLQLRRTMRPTDARPWIGTMQPVAIAAISSLVIIYVTGGCGTLVHGRPRWEPDAYRLNSESELQFDAVRR
ncbi:MAG: hypothetical protein WBW84_00080 [Acidobacteriaceae bacterium]